MKYEEFIRMGFGDDHFRERYVESLRKEHKAALDRFRDDSTTSEEKHLALTRSMMILNEMCELDTLQKEHQKRKIKEATKKILKEFIKTM